MISSGVKLISDKKENTVNTIIRAKIEEGYYRCNKRTGFWKFYNNDGTLKDSVEYKNDVAVTD